MKKKSKIIYKEFIGKKVLINKYKPMRTTIITIILLVSIMCSAQTTEQVRDEIRRQGLPHTDIVLAQARLESGNFTSRLTKTHNNIFGIRHGKKYARYARWQDCVADYKKCISNRYKGGCYYSFLVRIGYAQDGKKYVTALKKF